MAYSEVLTTDTPNSGRTKWNTNDSELYARLGTVEGRFDANGLVLPGNLPSLATTETYTVASEAAMLALTCQRGDIAVRTDFDPDRSYILAGDDAAVLGNWTQITFAGAGGITQEQADGRYVRITGDPNDGQFFKWQESTGTLVPVDAPVSGGAGSLLLQFVTASAAATTWANQPAALTEFRGEDFWRIRVDLAKYSEARHFVNLNPGGATSADLRVQYSSDGSVWNYLDSSNGLALNIGISAGNKISPWTPLVSSAKADVYLRLVGTGGDGVADPAFRRVNLELR